MKNQLTKIMILFAILMIIGCDTNVPTDEAELIPWDKMSGKLAYSRIDSMDNRYGGVLFVIDSYNQKIDLIKTTKDYHFNFMSWNPDGSQIIFSHFLNRDTSKWGIYNIDIKNGKISTYYSGTSHAWYPSWSLDGKLAYSYNDGLEHADDLFIDGESFLVERGFHTKFNRAAWSPDSKYIVVSVWTQNSQGELYKFSINDRSYQEPIALNNGEWNDVIFSNPIYSPGGDKIAYVNMIPGKKLYEIWIMNDDGSKKERITTGYMDKYPAWSPDGSMIAFSRPILNPDGSSKSCICLVDINTCKVTQITKNKGSFPIWLP